MATNKNLALLPITQENIQNQQRFVGAQVLFRLNDGIEITRDPGNGVFEGQYKIQSHGAIPHADFYQRAYDRNYVALISSYDPSPTIGLNTNARLMIYRLKDPASSTNLNGTFETISAISLPSVIPAHLAVAAKEEAYIGCYFVPMSEIDPDNFDTDYVVLLGTEIIRDQAGALRHKGITLRTYSIAWTSDFPTLTLSQTYMPWDLPSSTQEANRISFGFDSFTGKLYISCMNYSTVTSYSRDGGVDYLTAIANPVTFEFSISNTGICTWNQFTDRFANSISCNSRFVAMNENYISFTTLNGQQTATENPKLILHDKNANYEARGGVSLNTTGLSISRENFIAINTSSTVIKIYNLFTLSIEHDINIVTDLGLTGKTIDPRNPSYFDEINRILYFTASNICYGANVDDLTIVFTQANDSYPSLPPMWCSRGTLLWGNRNINNYPENSVINILTHSVSSVYTSEVHGFLFNSVFTDLSLENKQATPVYVSYRTGKTLIEIADASYTTTLLEVIDTNKISLNNDDDLDQNLMQFQFSGLEPNNKMILRYFNDLSNDLLSLDLGNEKSMDNGLFSAADGTVSLLNINRRYTQRNAASPFFGYLRANQECIIAITLKREVFDGLGAVELPIQATRIEEEKYRLLTGVINDFGLNPTDKTVQIKIFDNADKLINYTNWHSKIYESWTPIELAREICAIGGVEFDEENSAQRTLTQYREVFGAYNFNSYDVALPEGTFSVSDPLPLTRKEPLIGIGVQDTTWNAIGTGLAQTVATGSDNGDINAEFLTFRANNVRSYYDGEYLWTLETDPFFTTKSGNPLRQGGMTCILVKRNADGTALIGVNGQAVYYRIFTAEPIRGIAQGTGSTAVPNYDIAGKYATGLPDSFFVKDGVVYFLAYYNVTTSRTSPYFRLTENVDIESWVNERLGRAGSQDQTFEYYAVPLGNGYSYSIQFDNTLTKGDYCMVKAVDLSSAEHRLPAGSMLMYYQGTAQFNEANVETNNNTLLTSDAVYFPLQNRVLLKSNFTTSQEVSFSRNRSTGGYSSTAPSSGFEFMDMKPFTDQNGRSTIAFSVFGHKTWGTSPAEWQGIRILNDGGSVFSLLQKQQYYSYLNFANPSNPANLSVENVYHYEHIDPTLPYNTVPAIGTMKDIYITQRDWPIQNRVIATFTKPGTTITADWICKHYDWELSRYVLLAYQDDLNSPYAAKFLHALNIDNMEVMESYPFALYNTFGPTQQTAALNNYNATLRDMSNCGCMAPVYTDPRGPAMYVIIPETLDSTLFAPNDEVVPKLYYVYKGTNGSWDSELRTVINNFGQAYDIEDSLLDAPLTFISSLNVISGYLYATYLGPPPEESLIYSPRLTQESVSASVQEALSGSSSLVSSIVAGVIVGDARPSIDLPGTGGVVPLAQLEYNLAYQRIQDSERAIDNQTQNYSTIKVYKQNLETGALTLLDDTSYSIYGNIKVGTDYMVNLNSGQIFVTDTIGTAFRLVASYDYLLSIKFAYWEDADLWSAEGDVAQTGDYIVQINPYGKLLFRERIPENIIVFDDAGSPVARQLTKSNGSPVAGPIINGLVTVTNLSRDTRYEEDVNYTIDYDNATIIRIETGSADPALNIQPDLPIIVRFYEYGTHPLSYSGNMKSMTCGWGKNSLINHGIVQGEIKRPATSPVTRITYYQILPDEEIYTDVTGSAEGSRVSNLHDLFGSVVRMNNVGAGYWDQTLNNGQGGYIDLTETADWSIEMDNVFLGEDTQWTNIASNKNNSLAIHLRAMVYGFDEETGEIDYDNPVGLGWQTPALDGTHHLLYKTDDFGNYILDDSGNKVPLSQNKCDIVDVSLTASKLEIFAKNHTENEQFIIKVTLVGYPLNRITRLYYTHKDIDSIDRYGDKAKEVNVRFLDNEYIANWLARRIVDYNREEVPNVSGEFFIEPYLAIEDHVRVLEPESGLQQDYFEVISWKHHISLDSASTSVTLRMLEPSLTLQTDPEVSYDSVYYDGGRTYSERGDIFSSLSS